MVVKDEMIAARLTLQWRRIFTFTLAALTGQPSTQIEVNFIAAALPLIPSPDSYH